MISSRSKWQVSDYSLSYQRSKISHRICCLMKTLQKSSSSTQLLTSLSSTLNKPEKRFQINTKDQQIFCKVTFVFFYSDVDAFILFIQTLELLNETYFLTWWWWYQLVIYNCDHNSYHIDIDFYNSIIKFLETS